MTTLTKSSRKWTVETLRALVAEVNPVSRSAFKSAHSGAYKSASQQGVLFDIGLPDSAHDTHTLESIQALVAAQKPESRFEFKRAHASAYATARTNGWLPLLGLPPTRCKPHTQESVRALVASSSPATRTEFQLAFPGVYSAAHDNGWLDDIGLPSPLRVARTLEDIKTAVASYSPETRIDFQKNRPREYDAAARNGWLERIGLPPVDYKAPDANVFYVCRLLGRYADEYRFKVGITSKRRGKARIREWEKAMGVTSELVYRTEVRDGRSLERFALSLGRKVNDMEGDGCTEVREYNGDDLDRVITFALSTS